MTEMSRRIIHDAQLIKGVTVDDSDKADGKVLSFDQDSDTIVYIPRCPEIVIKAIQHVSITIPIADTSVQILINEVDPDNTFLIFGGTRSNSGEGRITFARIELLDAIHILATRGYTGVALYGNVSVIECTAGIKSIQRGTIVLSSAVIHDATITEVDTDKTFVSHLGVESTQTALYRALLNIYLLDSTTIRAERVEVAGTITVSYEVVEFV